MALGEDEVVVRRVLGGGEVVAQIAGEQHRHQVGGRHRGGRVAGAGGGAGAHRVDAQLLSQLMELLATHGCSGVTCSKGPRGYPIATIRSIGIRASSAISAGTLTSNFISRRQSRSFGRVIIFMYLQKAIRLASIRFACGAACCSG